VVDATDSKAGPDEDSDGLPARHSACPECGDPVGLAQLCCAGCALEPPLVELLSAAQGRTRDGVPTGVFAVWPGTWSIGRSRSCDIVLRDSSVSRRHAAFVHDARGRLWIEDQGGANGVYVGAEKVTRAALAGGDVLQVGRLTLRVAQASPDTTTTERLPPQLQQLSRAGADVGAEAAVLALDHLQLGVVLLRADGSTLVVNQAARGVLSEADGLSLSAGRTLQCRDRATEARLRELMHPDAARAGAVLVSRNGRRPLTLLVTRLDGTGEAGGLRAVFISDPERGVARAEEILARLYALTPAEARLAGELLEGRSLEDAADQLGITIHTARTHLRRIFGKTDTRRQSELVLLLLRGTGQVQASRS
jgi:DNA-binding CsgD family transcriptional regulator